MAEGKSREAWNHTAAVLAMLANTHRDPKRSRAVKPRDLHPLLKGRRPQRRSEQPRVGVEALKAVFVDHRPAASL
jgi:hypothetical protein